MIVLACTTCSLALRTVGNHDEVDHLIGMRSEWYPNRYPCPRSGCGSMMVLSDTVASTDIPNLEVHELSPQEVFQALCGMGLPNEKDCNADYVRSTLVGATIASLGVRSIAHTGRSILEHFTLSNGIRIYLGSSPLGAVVYRIAPVRRHVDEIDHG